MATNSNQSKVTNGSLEDGTTSSTVTTEQSTTSPTTPTSQTTSTSPTSTPHDGPGEDNCTEEGCFEPHLLYRPHSDHNRKSVTASVSIHATGNEGISSQNDLISGTFLKATDTSAPWPDSQASEHPKWNLKVPNTDAHFLRFQKRLAYRLFTVLLILNLITLIIETLWIPGTPFETITMIIRFISFIVCLLCLLCPHNERWLQATSKRQLLISLAIFGMMLLTEYASTYICLLVNWFWSPEKVWVLAQTRPVFNLLLANQLLLPYPSRFYSSLTSLLLVLIEFHLTFLLKPVTPWYAPLATSDRLVDVLFYIFTSCTALYISKLLDTLSRRAFAEHQCRLEAKFKVITDKEAQERLLSTYLPKYLMKKVRSDIRSHLPLPDQNPNGLWDHSPIRYIGKHKNVTILYGDIVKSMDFTRIVKKKIINKLYDLFGRFDSAAEKHNCNRIKFLGDCYYCVSGIPEPDPKHAENGLLMGLDMLDIIRKFRHDIGVEVDMRIGVHSGMILGGLLGLKKWEFDIWSRDTRRASQMEEFGQPGRVHITKTTRDLISPAILADLSIVPNKRKICHALYHEESFLVERKKASPRTPFEMKEQEEKRSPNESKVTPWTAEAILQLDEPDQAQRESSIESESTVENGEPDQQRAFQEWSISTDMTYNPKSELELAARLQYENLLHYLNESLIKTIDAMPFKLRNQYRDPDLEIHPVFFFFISKRTSQCVRPQQIEFFGDPKEAKSGRNSHRFLWRILKWLPNFDWSHEWEYLQQEDQLFPYYLLAAVVLCLTLITIRSMTFGSLESQGNLFCFFAIFLSAATWAFTRITPFPFLVRLPIWALICALVVSSTLNDMTHCQKIESNLESDKSSLYKWSHYYTYSWTLSLTCISLFLRIPFWFKFLFSTLTLLGIGITGFIFSSCSIFQSTDALQNLCIVYLLHHILDRQQEYLGRLDFQWSRTLEEGHTEDAVRRQVNQQLLERLLPVHLANRYLKYPGQMTHLYKESYRSVSVVFASIYNFFHLYTEDGQTNDIQYISILDEIICEFDKLLELPEFKDSIEKIKLINSTYMAAAGLYPGRPLLAKVPNSSEKNASDLVTLIRFSMSLIKILERFNLKPHIRQARQWKDKVSELKLKIGISSGPVSAGVITGPVKPNYDILGDTVNLASRMYTYGEVNQLHLHPSAANLLLEHANGVFKLKEAEVPKEIKGIGLIKTYTIDYDPDICP